MRLVIEDILNQFTTHAQIGASCETVKAILSWIAHQISLENTSPAANVEMWQSQNMFMSMSPSVRKAKCASQQERGNHVTDTQTSRLATIMT